MLIYLVFLLFQSVILATIMFCPSWEKILRAPMPIPIFGLLLVAKTVPLRVIYGFVLKYIDRQRISKKSSRSKCFFTAESEKWRNVSPMQRNKKRVAWRGGRGEDLLE